MTNQKTHTGSEDCMRAAHGGGHRVALGRGWRKRRRWGRRRLVRYRVVITLVNRVVKSQSGQGVGEPLIRLGRVKPEPEFDAGFQLVEVFVSDALAALELRSAVDLLAAVPCLVSVGVRGPGMLLIERRRRRGVRFRHGLSHHPARGGGSEGPRALGLLGSAYALVWRFWFI